MNKIIQTVICLLTLSSVHAASIDWNSPTDVSGISDVATTGALVQAINASAAGSAGLTVNGVTFSAASVLDNNNGIDVYTGTTGNSAYDTLISNVDFGSETSITVGNSMLVPGRQYLIQVWYADTRNAMVSARNMTFGDGEALESTISLNAGSVQYASGTFTADGSSQTLTINGDNGSGGTVVSHLNAFQIRDLSPVLPASSHDFYYNLAKYQSVKADSYTTANPVQYANDGFVSQDNRWVSSSTGPHWLEIELAVPMIIGSAHLFSGGATDAAMSDFVLQYQNGESWIDIAGTDVSDNTLPNLNLVFDAPVFAKVFRLYTTDSTACVRDLALYPPTTDGARVQFGVDVDLNVAKMRQYAYSSVDGAGYPKLAIDGYADNTSAWMSTDAAGPHDLEIHLPQPENIRGIQLYSGYEGAAGTQIHDFEVAYDNGSGWVVFDGGSVSGNSETDMNLWFDTAVVTKKIRLRSLDSSQAIVRELVVLPENNAGGYPLWTDVLDEAPPMESFIEYEDSYFTIENRASGLSLSTSTGGSIVSEDEALFQVLLNVGTDTYRLRSIVSSNCFEVALASTNAGAAIVEGEYASMPHQLWRLEDAGDGNHVRIVNVWSGFVLDVDGSDVVQQEKSSSPSQEWAINYVTHAPKKGQVAFFHYNKMYQPSWFYDWNSTGEDECEYGDYHPMQWSGMASTEQASLRYQPDWYTRSGFLGFLGFNEPDKADQANISEDVAAYRWPRFERTKLPLVGPCPAQNNGTWRKAYEAMAVEEGFRTEYMALHWYATANGGSPQNLINVVNNLYNTYGKPIWITEFAVKDWYGTGNWNRNQLYHWLAEFMWRAESIPHLKKYSIFEWGTEDNNSDPTVKDGPTMGLHVRNDKTNPGWEDLSELGLMVAGWDGRTELVEDSWYVIHNMGSYYRLQNNPEDSGISTENILQNDDWMQWELIEAASGNFYIAAKSDGRRLSYTGSGVSLASGGATGADVEWSMQEDQYGWFYINHPSSGMRLRINFGNFSLVDTGTGTATDNFVKWRFIRLAGSQKRYLPNQLMGHWSMDIESETMALDSSDYQYEGILVNGPEYVQGAGTNKYLSFDKEQSQYVNVTDLPDLPDGFTISMWVRSDTPTWNTDGNGVLASCRNQFVLWPWGDSTQFSFNVFNTNNVQSHTKFDLSTISGFELTDWHHYVGIYDDTSGEILLYVDGVLRTTTYMTPGTLNSDSSSMLLGRDENSSRYFSGDMDDVRLYNYALSGDAINDLYTSYIDANPFPSADDKQVSLDMNGSVAVTLSGYSVAGHNLTYSVSAYPVNGTLSGAAPNLTYIPDADFWGKDSFSYTVNDGTYDSDPATVSVVVFSPEMYWTAKSAPQSGGVLSSGLFNTNGTLIYAENTGGPELTFDGITFEAGTDASSNVLGVESPNFTGYHSGTQISSSGQYPNLDSVTPTLRSLTIGEIYRVQLLFFDCRSGQAGSRIFVDDNDLGQYANGSSGAGILASLVFVAEDTELSFKVERTTSDGTTLWTQVQLNAVSLHQLDTEAFEQWLASYGLTGTDALPESDVEPDGLDNLMEYALGGNPAVDDAAVIAPQLIVANGYADLVYDRNTDPALSFTVTATEDLQTAFSNDIPVFGESEEIGGFKTVTNRTDAVGTSKFIKLEVQK
ncbi:glycosyl hydrolase [Pontiellaceae bacterium B12219]|nr:glycosyl hydrolase [Pontiellaceae bacterium B12219]